MTRRSKAPLVRFGLITHPRRYNWPIHGCFVMRKDSEILQSDDVFSVEACREFIQLAIENGYLKSDDAATLERNAISAGLPDRKTRFDLIAQSFAKDQCERLIAVISGAEPPEPGSSGQASFERCREGLYCGSSDHCLDYPEHYALFPAGINTNYQGVVFSPEGVKQKLKRTVETGLLLQQETDALMPLASQLGATPEKERADRLCQHLSGDLLAIELDLVFGFRKRNGKPRFSKCEGHYHLSLENHKLINGPLQTEHDIRLVIDELMMSGFLSKEEQTELYEELATMPLPQGDDSNSIFGQNARPTLRIKFLNAQLLSHRVYACPTPPFNF